MLRKITMRVFLNRISSKIMLAGAFCLISVLNLSAQTVLLEESFETYPPGTFWSGGGWVYTNDSVTGGAPLISTNVFDGGTQSLMYDEKNDSVYSPLLDVSKTDKIVVTFRVAQTTNLTYKAEELEASSYSWWNDRFDLSARFDAGEKVNIFRDYGILDGHTGYYTGTPLRAARNNGIANGAFIDYEIAINVADYSSIRLNFLGWSIAAGGPRKHYLDTVKVVTVPRGTVMVIR